MITLHKRKYIHCGDLGEGYNVASENKRDSFYKAITNAIPFFCSYLKKTILNLFSLVPVEGCCYHLNLIACLPLVYLALLILSGQMWWNLLCMVPPFLGGLHQSCQWLTCSPSLACNGVGPICNQCQSRPSTTVKYYSGKLSQCPPWSGFHQSNYAPTDNI